MISLENLIDLASLAVGNTLEALMIWLAIVGWGLPFVLGIGALSMKNLGAEYFLAALVLGGLGLVNGYYAGLYFDLSVVALACEAFLPLVVFSAGPTIWFGLKAYVDPLFEAKPVYLLHLLPGILVSILLGSYLYSSQLGVWPLGFAVNTVFCLKVGFAIGVMYGVVSLKSFIQVYRDDKGEDQATRYRHAFLAIVGIVIIVLASAGYLILVMKAISPLLPLLTSGILLIVAVAAYCRYPNLFEVLLESIEAAPHRRTALPEGVIAHIEERLSYLMEVEKQFREPDISLPGLAARLEVTPHQLSEYLNFHVGSNFSRFINGYRVEEIKNKLIEKPSTAILELALESGFNSKSTFNTAFSDIVGTTPSAWRRSNR